MEGEGVAIGYELDFLPVGEESKGGDAIAIRYGNLTGTRSEQTVIVVDGGYLDSGEALVEHIRNHFQTDYVDIVVSTHPDRDHIKGLEVVLRKLGVGQLWMHRPAAHDETVAASRFSVNKAAVLGETLAKSLNDSDSLLAIATELGVPIVEPFTGLSSDDGALLVLGPDESYYEELLRQMRGTSSGQTLAMALSKAFRAVQEAVFDMVPEGTWLETLTETSDVSPSNNSSVVLSLVVGDDAILLTGDAGAEALHRVVDQLDARGISAGFYDFVQIPHHGSRHNVTPSLLDRLLGPKGTLPRAVAYASTPRKNPERKHPAKKTLNAFTRRGYRAFDTAGVHLMRSLNAPTREGFTTVTEHQLYIQVENHND